MVHSLIENLGTVLTVPKSNNNTIPKKVASGKLKKDKDGNWEFEYDNDDSGDSEEHDNAATIQGGTVAGAVYSPIESATIGATSENVAPPTTLNLVIFTS